MISHSYPKSTTIDGFEQKIYILTKEIRPIYFSARQSTYRSVFLAVVRGTPDYQASDFCLHTVEGKSMKKEDVLKLNKNNWKTLSLKLKELG